MDDHAKKIYDTHSCAVCGALKPEPSVVTAAGSTIKLYGYYHVRLGVFVCSSCPQTHVNGEDISHHCTLSLFDTTVNA